MRGMMLRKLLTKLVGQRQSRQTEQLAEREAFLGRETARHNNLKCNSLVGLAARSMDDLTLL